MNKSTFGLLLAGAALVFTLSPDARKAARKLAVGGVGAVLDLTDQLKDAAASVKTGVQEKEKGTEHSIFR